MSTTVTVVIFASASDAFQYADGSGFNTTARLEVTSSALASERAITGLQYAGVAIPQGAQILTASLLVRVFEEDDGIDAVISGQAIDDAAVFSAGDDVVSRTKTANSAAWNAPTQGTENATSPQIAHVIQEIVNRPGWASGNGLALFLEGTANAPKQVLKLRSFDTDSFLTAPVLFVTHAVGRPKRAVDHARDGLALGRRMGGGRYAEFATGPLRPVDDRDGELAEVRRGIR